jgi:predicted HicB family RNase H-like nuclease
MAKRSWAKGRKHPIKLVRLEPQLHFLAKEQADKDCKTLKEWVSNCVKQELEKRNIYQ